MGDSGGGIGFGRDVLADWCIMATAEKLDAYCAAGVTCASRAWCYQ